MKEVILILATVRDVISAGEITEKQNDLSDLEVISASKCKESQWLKKGQCQPLTGIGQEFPNFPEIVIQSLREKMRDDYWNWEREKVPGFFQKILKKLKVRYLYAPKIGQKIIVRGWSQANTALHLRIIVMRPISESDLTGF